MKASSISISTVVLVINQKEGRQKKSLEIQQKNEFDIQQGNRLTEGIRVEVEPTERGGEANP